MRAAFRKTFARASYGIAAHAACAAEAARADTATSAAPASPTVARRLPVAFSITSAVPPAVAFHVPVNAFPCQIVSFNNPFPVAVIIKPEQESIKLSPDGNSPMKPIRRVAVLGAGTMGSRIAAHLASAQIPSLLLDVTGEAVRSGLEAALKGRPAAFFVPESARLIATGSFDNDLAKIENCDWIVEAVTENLAIKRALYDRVQVHRAPGTIVSTNTSGIPLARIAEGYPAEFREHFLGTHFFNPPRYLHLVELIPGHETHPDILARIAAFCDRHLGKGVVPCKDTPNFIGNRIGAFFGSTVQRLTVEHDLTIEEVDAHRAVDRPAEERQLP